MHDNNTALVRYDAMCHAIAAAYEVDEVKDIRDQAVALETYARQAHNIEAEQLACEIRLRAERKAGALSAKLEKSPGGRPAKTPPTMGRVSKRDALHKAGVTPKQAEQWEKLAAVPEPDFEAALADNTAIPTTAGIIRASEEPKRNPVSADALWLWGRLLDFQRNGTLARDPSEVMSTMTPEMLDDVHTLAPRVVAWLKRIGGPPNVQAGEMVELPAMPAKLAKAPAEITPLAETDFDRFWRIYPRRVGKGDARKAWAAAIKKGADTRTIIAGAERYAAERAGQDERYTAHAATWIHGERWTDEPATNGAGRPKSYTELAMSMIAEERQ